MALSHCQAVKASAIAGFLVGSLIRGSWPARRAQQHRNVVDNRARPVGSAGSRRAPPARTTRRCRRRARRMSHRERMSAVRGGSSSSAPRICPPGRAGSHEPGRTRHVRGNPCHEHRPRRSSRCIVTHAISLTQACQASESASLGRGLVSRSESPSWGLRAAAETGCPRTGPAPAHALQVDAGGHGRPPAG